MAFAHGTYYAYERKQCRCRECRTWNENRPRNLSIQTKLTKRVNRTVIGDGITYEPFAPFRERYNFLIDFSGDTAVYVCPRCGYVGGTFWTTADAISDARRHRTTEHQAKDWPAMQHLCLYCDKPAHSRGMCPLHVGRAQLVETLLREQEAASIETTDIGEQAA